MRPRLTTGALPAAGAHLAAAVPGRGGPQGKPFTPCQEGLFYLSKGLFFLSKSV